MRFWQRRGREDGADKSVSGRHEQKRRSIRADEEYYRAMRTFALEAHDADGVRFYDQKIGDLQMLRYELEALSDDGAPRGGDR